MQGYIHHHRDRTPLSDQVRVGPRKCGESRLQRLYVNEAVPLPDYLKPDVLPESLGGLSYQEVTDNMEKQGPLPFRHTDRAERVKPHGSVFEGSCGDGVHHLQFDMRDTCEQMDPESRGKKIFISKQRYRQPHGLAYSASEPSGQRTGSFCI